ncbi:MAG: hypothetical protein IPJ99_00810 [Betaproteobacteria bacterium]|nr:hypothetical protein [Betaproteobacteria bacterium]
MLSETDSADERDRLWAMMEGDLDELDNLIDTSLTYARLERRSPRPHFTHVPMADWLSGQVETMRVLGRHLEVSSIWPTCRRIFPPTSTVRPCPTPCATCCATPSSTPRNGGRSPGTG